MPPRANNNCVYAFFFKVCTHDLFNVIFIFAIVLNTGLLALDRYPISDEATDTLELLNEVLTWTFFVEMMVKIIGLGVKEYTADSFNIFDATVVMISMLEMLFAILVSDFSGGGAISALRAVRLLRVFKLARSWTSFRDLLQNIVVTLKDIRNFTVLMLIFMFIFTLLGMELFAYRVKFSDADKTEPVVAENIIDAPGVWPRESFNGFVDGFTTIFIVFIGEDWNSVMYDHTRALGTRLYMLFFIPIFIIGNLILLNLFLAILLKNFEEPPGKDADDDEGSSTGKLSITQKISKYSRLICFCCFKKDEEREGQDQSGRSNLQKVMLDNSRRTIIVDKLRSPENT